MTRAALQFIILVAAFLLTWFLLSKIQFTENMEIEKFSKEQEKKLGELLLDGLKQSHDLIRNDSINEIVDSIFNEICRTNKIDGSQIKVLILDNSEVNAFALPGDQLVVLTGLIKYCKTPEELAGVMAHEISHIQKDHVMKKLVKEVGVAMLFVIIGGNGSFEIISEVLRTISSRAFDRDQETDADMNAVKLLANAKINPTGLSDFLFRLSQESDELADDLIILSTHPGSAERTAEIVKESKKYSKNYVPLKFAYWENRNKTQ